MFVERMVRSRRRAYLRVKTPWAQAHPGFLAKVGRWLLLGLVAVAMTTMLIAMLPMLQNGRGVLNYLFVDAPLE